MTTMEALFSRKSVRAYTGENITDDELRQILKAAYAAPVGMGDYASLRLTVVRNPALLEKIDRAAAKLFGQPEMHPLYGAPTLIIVSTRLPEKGSGNLPYSNGAIVTQNMAIAATELGVGVCHIWGAMSAVRADPALMAELKLPEGHVPCCSVCLGRTEEMYSLRDIPDGRIDTAFLD